MNKQEQRIAIAEACGWKGPNHPETKAFTEGWTKPKLHMINPAGHIGFIGDCPDYLNDLNAMHEAEEVLDMHQQYDYGEALARMTIGKEFDDPEGFTPNGFVYYPACWQPKCWKRNYAILASRRTRWRLAYYSHFRSCHSLTS